MGIDLFGLAALVAKEFLYVAEVGAGPTLSSDADNLNS
jgi:hypothetical protein